MTRNLKTILFALSLVSVGCTRDSEDETPGPKQAADGAPAEAGRSWWSGEDQEGDDEEGEREQDEDEGHGHGDDGEDERKDDDAHGSRSRSTLDSEVESDGDEGEASKDDDIAGLDPSTPSAPGVSDAPIGPVTPVPGNVTLPPSNGQLDYQLGGDYALPAGVKIVSRDRTGKAAAGAYNVCYVNGFQTQPNERSFWTGQHPDLVLRNQSGSLVIDPEWPDELLLDISTAAKREAIAKIAAAWITECKTKGFQAVEVDNLDSYARSKGLLREEHAIAFMRLLSDRAHAAGLAIAQKNSAEIAPRKAQLGTDFAVVEQCNEYDECGAYTRAYGDKVLVIEYKEAAFQKGCKAFPQLSIVLRDVKLVTPGDSGYVRKGC